MDAQQKDELLKWGDSFFQFARFFDTSGKECHIGEIANFEEDVLLLGVVLDSDGEIREPMKLSPELAQELAGLLLYFAINGCLPNDEDGRYFLTQWIEAIVQRRLNRIAELGHVE